MVDLCEVTNVRLQRWNILRTHFARDDPRIRVALVCLHAERTDMRSHIHDDFVLAVGCYAIHGIAVVVEYVAHNQVILIRRPFMSPESPAFSERNRFGTFCAVARVVMHSKIHRNAR